MIIDEPRRVFVPTSALPAPTSREFDLGWPTKFCGGHLLTDDLRFSGMAGVAVAVDEETAEEMGCIEETALSFEDVLDAMTEEGLLVDAMWARRFRLVAKRPRPSPAEVALRPEALVKVVARKRGRPRGATHDRTLDRTNYDGREKDFQAAVAAQCSKELERDYPAIDIASLRRIVGGATRRVTLPRSVPPRSPPQWADPKGGMNGLVPRWLPKLKSVSAMVEWAFISSLPTAITQRDAVIQTIEFLGVRSDPHWDCSLGRSPRLFALASLLVQEAVPRRGRDPRTIKGSIDAELNAMNMAAKTRATARLVRRPRT